jgi:hypothetical protein
MRFQCTCGHDNLVCQHQKFDCQEYIMEVGQEISAKCDSCGEVSSFWLTEVEVDDKVKLGGKRKRSRRNQNAIKY